MSKIGSRAMYRAWNRDKNEKLFTNLLDRFRIEYTYGKPGDGYDLLVQVQPMELWEVKDPAQKWSLTKTEQAKREYCKTHGIPYRIVEHLEQAINAIAERTITK